MDEVPVNSFYLSENTRKAFWKVLLLIFSSQASFLFLCKDGANELIFTVVDWQYVDQDIYQSSALSSILQLRRIFIPFSEKAICS